MDSNKMYHDECPIFEQFGQKWISVRLPYEETTVGDKYAIRYRKKNSNDDYKEDVKTLYFDRFTDGHILDIQMDDNAKIDEWFEIDAIKVNLTKMFGEGNEPTPEQFEAMFPKPYYTLEEGTRVNFVKYIFLKILYKIKFKMNKL